MAFKTSLAQTSPESLRHRQMSFLLVCNNTKRKCGTRDIETVSCSGASAKKKKRVATATRYNEPLLTTVRNDLAASKEGKPERIVKRRIKEQSKYFDHHG